MAIILMMCLSSCIEEDFSRFILDGETYVTGFYEGLYSNSESVCFRGDLRQNSNRVFDGESFEIDGHTAYRIDFAPFAFDMYSVLVNIWRFDIFASEDDFNEAQTYYQDPSNFYYYAARWNKSVDSNNEYFYDEVKEIEYEDGLGAKLDALLASSGDEEKLIDFMDEPGDFYYFYKISKDGLFTTSREEFLLVGESLYLFSQYYDDDGYYGIKVDNVVSGYFRSKL